MIENISEIKNKLDNIKKMFEVLNDIDSEEESVARSKSILNVLHEERRALWNSFSEEDKKYVKTLLGNKAGLL
jgi:hypothetical protein